MEEDFSQRTWIGHFRKLLKGETASREDLLEILADSRWRSVLDRQELAMMQGVLEVSSLQVRDIMVPRSQMVVLEQDAPLNLVLRTMIECGHSRFPVIGDDRDEVLGILLAKDVLRFFVEAPGAIFNMKQFLRPAIVIPESKRLDALLQEFRHGRNHIAIVVDEYGGTAGLLTIEDVLEQIVGDIDDEHDPEEADHIQLQEEGRWLVMALTRIDEFNEYFQTDLDDDDYDTVGGLVMREFGRMPKRGESAAFAGFSFKVLQADRRRINSVEVTRVADSASST